LEENESLCVFAGLGATNTVYLRLLQSLWWTFYFVLIALFSAILRFSPPGSLSATYAVHLRLIGKGVVDFLLVVTKIFSLYSRGDTGGHPLKSAFLIKARISQF